MFVQVLLLRMPDMKMLLAETKRYTDANFTNKLTTKNRFTKNYILKNDIPNQNIENTHPTE